MHEMKGNLWDISADARVIPTNGATRGDGAAVMGRGVALQAKQRNPGIEHCLGESIMEHGNHVQIVCPHYSNLIAFPVKHHWREQADLSLVERSCKELLLLADQYPRWVCILLPRVGCGNGRLDWKDVSRVLEAHLDDRFIVVHLEE